MPITIVTATTIPSTSSISKRVLARILGLFVYVFQVRRTMLWLTPIRLTRALTTRHRFRRAQSILFKLELLAQGLEQGKRSGAAHLTGGWGLSGTTIFQSGYPFTARNVNGYNPIVRKHLEHRSCSPVGCERPAVGYAPGSGDYNADGNALYYPDALSYRQLTDNSAWPTGAVPKSNFAVPAFWAGGNRRAHAIRGPNFIETNINLDKEIAITVWGGNFQFRFESLQSFQLGEIKTRKSGMTRSRNATLASPRLLGRAAVLGESEGESRSELDLMDSQ